MQLVVGVACGTLVGLNDKPRLLHVQTDAADTEADTDSKCQLLLVLAEVTLDGSAPVICTPLFTSLFCQAASGGVHVTPQTKVTPEQCPHMHVCIAETKLNTAMLQQLYVWLKTCACTSVLCTLGFDICVTLRRL